jgi:phosphate-selective porin
VIALALALMLAGGAAAPALPSGQPSADAPRKAKKAKTEAPQPPAVPSPDEPLAADPDAPQPRNGGVRFVWRQHPSLRFGRVLRLDFQAKFQEDARASYEGAETTADLETWELHRARVGIQGTLFRRIEFEVERELNEQELSDKDVELGLTREPAWKDVYVNLAHIDNVQIQFGKFKIPFGLDTLTGVSQNDFIYRALGSSYLTPSRDIGVMAHGRFFRRGLSYSAGVFRHDGDNARSKRIQGGDQTFAARVTGLPLRRASAERFGAFEVGTSFAVSKVSDDSFRPNGMRGRTIVTQDTFYDSVYVKGRRVRWGADLDWTLGPGSLRTEYLHFIDQRREQGFLDDDLPNARHRSWFVSGTWLVTREPKARPVKPAKDFLRGGIGAIELAGRWERIWFDSVDTSDEPFSNPRAFNILEAGNKALTLGVNWTLNRFVKVQFNGIREQVEDPARNPVADGAAFWSRVLRLQLVL